MKLTCSVIKDILPLYLEGLDSEETHKIVEEHLLECEDCRKELEEIRRPTALPVSADIMPLKQLKRTLQKKKSLTILCSVIITLIVVIIGAGFALSPKLIPYSENIITFTTSDNGVLLANINTTIADYEISSYYSEEFEGQVYYISAWDTAWNNVINQNNSTSIPLNVNGEKVASVYFSPNDGSLDILVYGKSLFVHGGSLTTPQTLLSHLALCAGVFALLIGVIIFFARRHNKDVFILLKVEYLPIAYLLAHLLIKGFETDSYILFRELFAILLLTLPLYALALLLEQLYFKKVLLKQDI